MLAISYETHSSLGCVLFMAYTVCPYSLGCSAKYTNSFTVLYNAQHNIDTTILLVCVLSVVAASSLRSYLVRRSYISGGGRR